MVWSVSNSDGDDESKGMVRRCLVWMEGREGAGQGRACTRELTFKHLLVWKSRKLYHRTNECTLRCMCVLCFH